MRVSAHTYTYTHSWPALAWFWSVARGHGGRRSQLSGCDGLIQTPPPLCLRHRPSQTYTSIPQSLQPSTPSSSFSSSAAGPCLVGMFERPIEGGWRRGSQSPSSLWPVLEHAPMSPSLSHSVSFISVSCVSCLAVVLLSLHLAS